METIASAPLWWMVVLFWLIRAMIRVGHVETNEYTGNGAKISAEAGANKLQMEIEKMTPKYLPVPGESGDENDRDSELEM